MTAVQFNNEAIVFDNGSNLFKYGFAGDDSPLASIPTLIGYNENKDNFEEKIEKYIGNNAVLHRDTINIKSPIVQGKIVDWEAMENLWENILFNEMNDFEHVKLPVLLTAPSKGWKKGRMKMVQTMFEKFELPGCAIFSQSLLSLFSTGNVTGLAVEFGAGKTSVVPCYEGNIIPYAVNQIPVGGNDATTYLQQLLKTRCDVELDSSQFIVAQDIKEKTSYLLNYEGNNPSYVTITDEVYELPDGQIVTIDKSCRQECGEILFKPNLLPNIPKDTPGLIDIINDSINKCDRTLANEVLQNIALSGGGSMMPGLPERFEGELSNRLPSKKFKTIVDPHRNNAAWIGGSMLASIDTFKTFMITKAEYADEGPNIALKKTF